MVLTLIRRLSFDLIGLPPSIEEVDSFLNDQSSDAYEKLIDRLLDSSHFGERWARHWLDLIRYAETYGHEFDYPIPQAAGYRDYVIRAYNADVPYDQFVREHIAGDLIANPRRHPTDDFNESLLGTGFWFLGEATHAPVDVRGDEAERVDNQIDVMTKTFLGLTVGCARCHDHKFDAISTKDYYALCGFLQSSRRQLALLDPKEKIGSAVRAMNAEQQRGEASLTSAVASTSAHSNQQFSRYLPAANEVLIQNPKPGEETRSAAEEIAKAHQIEPQQLGHWVKTLREDAAKQPWHPLSTWQRLTAPTNAEDANSFAERRDSLRTQTAERIQNGEQAVANSTLFEDFNGDSFGPWFVSGHAFGQSPTHHRQWRPTTDGPLVPAGVAHSGTLSNKLQGALRSPTFEITNKYIHYRMAGRNGQIRLIIDGYVMDVYNRLLFN